MTLHHILLLTGCRLGPTVLLHLPFEARFAVSAQIEDLFTGLHPNALLLFGRRTVSIILGLELEIVKRLSQWTLLPRVVDQGAIH